MLKSTISTAMHTARGLIEEAETQARAEMRAAHFTNCSQCQSALVPFLKDTPHADDTATQAVMETLWEQCPTCREEYAEVLANEKCKHGIRGGFDNCSQCLDEWADANAPEDVVLDTPSRWEVENNV